MCQDARVTNIYYSKQQDESLKGIITYGCWIFFVIFTYICIIYTSLVIKCCVIMSDGSDTRCNTQVLPHVTFRSSLARALYEQIENDERLRQLDRTKWYKFNKTRVHEEMLKYFVQLAEDEATEAFYDNCENKQRNFFSQLMHTMMKPVFSLFTSQTSINGLFQRGSMFVLSTNHMKQLLRTEDTYKANKLLDLGAGDGCVTAQLEPFADQIYVTEMSPVMRWRLSQKNYTVVGVDDWMSDSYDFISCLNLLDRCDKPLTLLSQIKKSLQPNGVLLIAMVVPFSPYVEYNSREHEPVERMDIAGQTIEEQSESLYRKVLQPRGFTLISFTRLPYLCEGDFYQTFYYLQDILMLLKHTDTD